MKFTAGPKRGQQPLSPRPAFVLKAIESGCKNNAEIRQYLRENGHYFDHWSLHRDISYLTKRGLIVVENGEVKPV